MDSDRTSGGGVKLRSTELSWREIDGEMVVLDLASSRYLTVNQAGTVLMRLLSEERTTDDLVDGLVSTFEISREQAATDVQQFLGMLDDKGLLDKGEPVNQ